MILNARTHESNIIICYTDIDPSYTPYAFSGICPVSFGGINRAKYANMVARKRRLG
jgi:hypothetical protein